MTVAIPRRSSKTAASRLPVEAPAARRTGKGRVERDMSDADIEASRAPLIEHIIELRQRLIRALYAFFAAFIVCFYFSRSIYNILTWPYVQRGRRRRRPS